MGVALFGGFVVYGVVTRACSCSWLCDVAYRVGCQGWAADRGTIDPGI